MTGSTADTAQPLLSPSYYIVKALAPYAEVREPRPGRGDPILTLLEDKVSVMILADVGVVAGPAHDQLARFTQIDYDRDMAFVAVQLNEEGKP